MTAHFLRRALVAAVALLGPAAGMAAVPTAPVEPVVSDAEPGMVRIDDNRPASVSQAPDGNPIWAIPLKELSATRERPIFSPSRRPPSAGVVTAPYAPPQSARPPEADRPQLALVGTIAGNEGGIGIFLDSSSNTVLRLKTGEAYNGWILRVVRGREIVLEKGDKTATLALPVPLMAVPGHEDENEKDLKKR